MVRTVATLCLCLASCLSALGCTAAQDPYVVTESRAQTVNPVLHVYAKEFANLYGQSLPEIPITIGPLEAKVAGKCYMPADKDPANQVADSVFGESTQKKIRIVISSDFYSRHKDDHDAIQIVVFHELSHCILRRGHRDEMMETDDYGKIPRSMMHSVGTFGDKPFYRAYYDYYVKELFSTGVKKQEAARTELAASESEHDHSAHEDMGDCVEYVE
jgi:hypothetical protein